MILDSSALLAILLQGPERSDFIALIDAADITRISAASYVESSLVLATRKEFRMMKVMDDLIQATPITIEPVTAEQAMIARQAFLAFGKGRSPAKLNFGDCFSYALARAFNEPLLFKGADFAQTDIRPVR